MKKFSILLLLSLSLGCGGAKPKPPPKTVAVSGKVTLASGTPVTAGRIIFKPQSPGMQEAIADIGSDGKYSLTTYNKDDGTVPGDYKIVIENISYKTGTPLQIRLNVPAKYYNERTSDLIVKVVDAGDYPIQLK